MMTIENIVDVSGESVEAQLAQLNIERQLALDAHHKTTKLSKEAYTEKVFCTEVQTQLLTEQSQILDQWDHVSDASKPRLLIAWDQVAYDLSIIHNEISEANTKYARAVNCNYATLGPVVQCEYEIANLTKI
jgi:hypothetical protein